MNLAFKSNISRNRNSAFTILVTARTRIVRKGKGRLAFTVKPAGRRRGAPRCLKKVPPGNRGKHGQTTVAPIKAWRGSLAKPPRPLTARENNRTHGELATLNYIFPTPQSQCLSRSSGFGFFFAFAFAGREQFVLPCDLCLEHAAMIWPAFADDAINWRYRMNGLQGFLELTFRVTLIWAVDHAFDLSGKEPQNEFFGGFQPSIHIDRADQRFEGIGQSGKPTPASGRFLAFSEQDLFAEFDGYCETRQFFEGNHP